jgi:hypothetical protein
VKKQSFTVIYAYPETGSAKVTVCVSGCDRSQAQSTADQVLAEWGLDKKTTFIAIEEGKRNG